MNHYENQAKLIRKEYEMSWYKEPIKKTNQSTYCPIFDNLVAEWKRLLLSLDKQNIKLESFKKPETDLESQLLKRYYYLSQSAEVKSLK